MGQLRKRTRNGKQVYSWRGSVPVGRDERGKVLYREVERGLGTITLQEARERAKRLERDYHDTFDRPAPKVDEFVFADAVQTYIDSGGETRFLAPIVEGIGDKPVSDIDQDAVNALARAIYPDATPGTINRQVFTPILSVLNMPANRRRCQPPALTRPRGHDKSPALDIPDEAWFDAVLPLLNPKMRALVICLTLHGRRLSDFIKRTPADVDPVHWTLTVADTKTGVPVQVQLAEYAVNALKAIPGWQSQRWLFGTASRANVSRALREAAERAGVKSFGTHAIGRHSFATRLLREGKSLKFVQQAGGWATIKMPAERYGHLEKSEVQEEVNEIAQRWAKRRKTDKVVVLRAVK